MYLRETAVEAWNAAATAGSMEINMFFSSLTASFLALILSVIHAMNGSPRTVAPTLQIHCLGVFLSSLSYGK